MLSQLRVINRTPPGSWVLAELQNFSGEQTKAGQPHHSRLLASSLLLFSILDESRFVTAVGTGQWERGIGGGGYFSPGKGLDQFCVRQGVGVTALTVSSSPKCSFRGFGDSPSPPRPPTAPGVVWPADWSPSAGPGREGRTGPLPWWVSNRLP